MKKFGKIVAVVMALALIFCFAGCGGTKEPAEITVELGEGLPTANLGTNMTEEKISEELAALGLKQSYLDNDGQVDVRIWNSANTEKQTLDEYINELAKEHDGCIETKMWDGVECRLLTCFGQVDGKNYITKSYIFDAGEEFVSVVFIYHTMEIQLGDTNFYTWIPNCYKTRELTEYDKDNDGVAAYSAEKEDYLADLLVAEWNNKAWKYEDLVAYFAEEGDEFSISEEQFNAWAADGLNLEEYGEYFKIVFKPVDIVTLEHDGITFLLNDYRTAEDNVEYTNVIVTTMDGDNFAEICLVNTAEDWPALGKAIAYATHYGKQSK